jgi:putative flippase GtrA
MKPPAEPLLTRIARFARSVVTGSVATLVDFVTLTALVELAHLPPVRANVPALLAGAAVQFLGNRFMVFEGRHRPVGPQLVGFALVEVGTLTCNAAGFHLLVSLTRIPYPVARLLCSFLVYSFFSYPLWKRVFHQTALRQDYLTASNSPEKI